MPGHGESGLYELIELSKIIPAKSHIIGYSMGGRIAMNLIHSNPKNFLSATLLSAHLGLANEEERRIRFYEEETWIDCLKTEGIDSFIDKWYEKKLFQNSPIPSYRYRQNPDLLIAALRNFSLAKQQNFWNSLSIVSTISTFLYGECDIAYKPTFEKLKTLNANVHLIKKSTHAIHLENVSACITHIERSIHVAAKR